jgi:hypothetical protein
MDKEINKLVLKYQDLIKCELISFEKVKSLKKVMGVYLIYSIEGELMYVGSTNNFNVRFGTDLRHEATHTLMKKLLRLKIHEDRKIAADHFTNHYRYRIQFCDTKREAEALEHLAIWLLSPIYNL